METGAVHQEHLAMKPYTPKAGDPVWVIWADINEEPTFASSSIEPDVRQTREVFGEWRALKHEGYTVEYLFCPRGDTSMLTGAEIGGTAYPKGCILEIKPRRERRKKESTSETR